MEFNNLHIEGFRSIDILDINLNQKGTHLIKGPNGVGKTTLIDAIGWVAYGHTANGVSDVNTWKHARTKEYGGTLVSIYFKNDKHIYKVVRCYNYSGEIEGAKGRSQLFFYKDTVLSENKRKAEIQKEITEAIGLSYSLFMNSIFFGQGLKRLTQLTGATQKEIFDEIFDMTFISRARDIAKHEHTKRQEKFNSMGNTHKNLKRSLEVLQNTLDKAQIEYKEFKRNQKDEISELRRKRKLAAQAIIDLELKAPTEIKIRDVKTIKEDISTVKGLIRDAKNTKDSVTVEDLIDTIIKLLTAKEYKTALKKLKGLKMVINSLEIMQSRLSDYQDELQKTETYKYKLLQHEGKRDSYQDRKDSYTSQIHHTKAQKPSNIPESLRESIQRHREEIESVHNQITPLEKELEDYKWAYTEPLGNNGLKAYIFENSLHDLNEILMEYSKSIGITIQYYMDTANKRKDFTTYISMDGETILYEELSGGQKQLINLVMAFAMNELVSYTKGFNITFLDEVFENLSYDNIELVIGMIRKIFKDKTLFLISHHDSLPIGNSKVIEVQRIRGISHYKM